MQGGKTLVISFTLRFFTIEIVELPIWNGDFPVRKLWVYQRVKLCDDGIKIIGSWEESQGIIADIAGKSLW